MVPIGQQFVDVAGAIATPTGTVQIGQELYGQTATTSSTQSWAFGTAERYNITGAVSVLFVGRLGGSGPVINKGEATTNVPWSCSYASPSTFGFYRAGATDYQSFSGTGSINAVRTNSFIVWTQDGVTGTGKNARCFNNGEFITLAGGGMADAVAGANATAVTYGKTSGDFINSGGALIALFNRVLTDPEILSLYANPWQLFAAPFDDIWVPSAGSGATVTPGVGALALVGLAPSVVVDRIAQPSAGTLVLAGLAPSVTVNRIAQPDAGALVLAGLAPTVAATANHTAAPGAGTLSLAGLAPSLVVNHLLQPGAGALTLNGLAPTAVLGTVVQPSAGTLALAGLAPSVLINRIAQPGAGALVLAGLAPTVVATDNHVVEPGAGALVLAGQQPAAVTGGNAVAQPEQAALVLDGLQPTVATTSNRTVEPGAGALALEGLAPTVSVTANIVVNPLTGALIFTGLTPTVVVSDNHIVEPGAGTLALGGLAPEIPVQSPVAAPGAGALALEGLAPTVITTGGEDVATDPKLIARWPNVRVEGFGKRKKTPPPTPAPAQVTNMPGHPPVPRPLAGGLLAALADSPLPPAAPAPAPRVTATPTPTPTAAPTAAPAPRAAVAPPSPAPSEAPSAATPAPAPVPAPVPASAGITPEQMAALLQRMDALSEGMSSRLVEVNRSLQGDIERVTQLLEAERDARLARELRERNEARAKQIAARLLGGE